MAVDLYLCLGKTGVCKAHLAPQGASSTAFAARKTTTQKAPNTASLLAPRRTVLVTDSTTVRAPASVPTTPTSEMATCRGSSGGGSNAVGEGHSAHSAPPG